MRLRPIRVEAGVVYITLTKGYTAIADTEDMELLSEGNWQARIDGNTVYAQRNERVGGKQKKVQMHRKILGVKDGEMVDHINGDGLDNRKCNLRVATRSQNNMNTQRNVRGTSGRKGVTWNRACKKWQAQIKVNGKNIYLGLYHTKDEAHMAYAKASDELHGDYGCADYK